MHKTPIKMHMHDMVNIDTAVFEIVSQTLPSPDC